MLELRKRVRNEAVPGGLFVSAKTPNPLNVSGPLALEALVQVTLDAKTVVILPAPPADKILSASAAIATVVTTDAEKIAILLIDPVALLSDETVSGIEPQLKSFGFGCQILREPDIRSEPVCTNARLVWACRNYRVAAGDRIRILHAVSEQSISLVEAASAARGSIDAVAAVLSLVCADLLEIDLTQGPIAPET